MKKQKKRPEDLPRRTLHLDARVTQEEYDQVKQRAEECGMTVSKYARKCTLGHQPKYHLIEQEIEAFNQIGDARGDIVHFFTCLTTNPRKSSRAISRMPLSCVAGSCSLPSWPPTWKASSIKEKNKP